MMHICKIVIGCIGWDAASIVGWDNAATTAVSWSYGDEDIDFGNLKRDEIRYIMAELLRIAQDFQSPVVQDPEYALQEVAADAEDSLEDI